MTGPPDRWTANVVLGDGETVHLRPIRPDDASALAEFHRRQSLDSIYRRFFSPKPTLSDAELEHFTNVDLVDRAALVVERYGQLIAWGSYERWPGRDDADAAFMVDDEDHGKGIATLLLEHLAALARSNGITRFTAEVLADNRPMLAVFSRAGWPVERHFESGIIDLDFPLDETEEFLDSVERREQRADSRAMARLLLPRSVALVGASDRPGTVGAALWRHLTSTAAIPVHAVNPHRRELGGRPCWPDLRAVPGEVSLAVVAVPAAALDGVIDDCIASRVRGAVVLTSVEGTDVDLASMVDRARRYGLRIVGPGSMGVATSDRTIGLQASLVPVELPPGPVAISLQSGSLGASVLQLARDLDVGISWFVSLGDKADVSANDLLQFWEDDESTRVIAMYTESFGNPRKFARIARRVSRRRPIVAVRTGAAAIGPAGGALYQQAGLIEVPTVAALLDTVRVLVAAPVMRGPRVGLLANARSPATLAREALGAAGLETVEPPLPLDWRSSPEDHGRAVRAALDDDGIDALLVVHAPPLADAIDAPAQALDEAAAGATKPIVAVLMGGRSGPLRPGSPVPAFAFPEHAAGALGRLWSYGRWLADEAEAATEEVGDIDRARAARRIADALAAVRTRLDVAAAVELLAAYGIAVPASRRAAVNDAPAAADAIGYPVAVKAVNRHLGRSVEAGVALDLRDAAAVAGSVAVMHDALGADADAVVVQAMIPPGLDLRMRSSTDERIGPVVSVGLGGSTADLLADEPSRLAPLSTTSAEALLDASRAGPALAAAGLPAAAVADALVRFAQLVTDHPEIVGADLNPIIVSQQQAWVTDAMFSIGAARPATGSLRRLD
ncbi:bifunctional GNAT family N-acetyltransferase/acetate--CoA ligase family protein [soil metagenome]